MRAKCILLFTAFAAGIFQHDASSQPLEVQVDQRIELLGIVQLLAGNVPTATRLEFPYRDSVEAWFEPLADHDAILMFRRMAQRGFSFDAPVTAMLCCSDPPGISIRSPIPKEILARSSGMDSLRAWLVLLNKFAESARFDMFYRSHSSYYDRLVGETKELLDDDLLDRLHQYYGMRESGYEIVLSPLTTGGFGPRVELGPGQWKIYSVASPSAYSSDTLKFFSSKGLRTLVWHEFAHSFVNPLTEDHWRELEGVLQPFDSIAAGLPRWYRQRKASLDEHIVRAVTVRMITLYRGDGAGKQAMEQEVTWGFAFVPVIADWLREYETDRSRWPTFTSFFPEIVARLGSLQDKGR